MQCVRKQENDNKKTTTTTTTVTPKAKFKTTDIVDTMISNILPDLLFSLNQPLKSSDSWYSGMLQNTVKTYEYLDFFSFY
jgi:hypothetical protein